jgi:thiol-disulfide isomerase/thioredoxin
MEMKNGTRRLADFKGHAVLLNLWATWCVPCLKELPTLDEVEKQWSDSGLVVLPLSLDDMAHEDLRAFLKASAVDLPHLAVDSGEISNALTWNALPMTYLINREGNIIAHWAGATDWTDAQHTEWIQRALDKEAID